MTRRIALTPAAEQEIRDAGFSSLAEARRVVRDASRPLSAFYGRLDPESRREVGPAGPSHVFRHQAEEALAAAPPPYGERQLAAVVGPARARRAQELSAELRRYDVAVDEAGQAEDYQRLDALLAQSDVLLAELGDIFEAFEEGEEPISEGDDPWWVDLARAYADWQHWPGGTEPGPRFRGILQHHHIDASALSDDEVIAMAKEAASERLAWIARLREIRQGRHVPEHVRVLHEIARLRARKLSPATREALVRGAGQTELLTPNTPTHPALAAAAEGYRVGGFQKAMLYAWAAGLDPRQAYLAAKAVSS